MKAADVARIREVMRLIVEETTADVYRFDGQPFDGKTVAEYFANQAAAIVVLAQAVTDLLPPAEPERPAPPRTGLGIADRRELRGLG